MTELPELNDEFASEVSDFETLAEYKDDIKMCIRDRYIAQGIVIVVAIALDIRKYIAKK